MDGKTGKTDLIGQTMGALARCFETAWTDGFGADALTACGNVSNIIYLLCLHLGRIKAYHENLTPDESNDMDRIAAVVLTLLRDALHAYERTRKTDAIQALEDLERALFAAKGEEIKAGMMAHRLDGIDQNGKRGL